MSQWMRIPMLAVSLFIAVAGLAGLANGAAAAAKTDVAVEGTIEGGGVFAGVVSNLYVSVDEQGELVVTGYLAGSVVIEDEEIAVTQAFDASLRVLDGESCRLLHLEIGAIFIDAVGAELALEDVSLQTGGGGLLGGLLSDLTCTVTSIVDDAGVDNDRVARLLNRIFDRLHI